jgi:hypothetical protein
MAAPLAAQTDRQDSAQFAAGLQMGYASGFSIQAHGSAAGFADGFPLRPRLAIGYASVEPGRAFDARRVFINNNTNGTPEERGRVWHFKLDVLFPVHLLSLRRAYAFGGLRHARFNANFRFVGGNEDFDVRSRHWGLGGGLESYFGVSSRVDMICTGGLEYFFASTLTAHDTAYSPDGDDVNPREDFTYADAGAAVGQPKLAPSLLLGFSYRF